VVTRLALIVGLIVSNTLQPGAGMNVDPTTTTVPLGEALQTCRDILDGRYDDLPADALYFSGDMAEIRSNAGRALPFGPVTWPPRAQ
jgi:hypothetical protein